MPSIPFLSGGPSGESRGVERGLVADVDRRCLKPFPPGLWKRNGRQTWRMILQKLLVFLMKDVHRAWPATASIQTTWR